MEEKRKKKHTTHHRAIFRLLGCLLLNITLIVFFSNHTITTFLSSIYLQWLPATLSVIAGGLTIAGAFQSFSTLLLLSALDKNINEVRTLRQHM